MKNVKNYKAEIVARAADNLFEEKYSKEKLVKFLEEEFERVIKDVRLYFEEGYEADGLEYALEEGAGILASIGWWRLNPGEDSTYAEDYKTGKLTKPDVLA